MSIHKFIRKPLFEVKRQPQTVHWQPHANLKYESKKISPIKWLIYLQEEITIKPHEVKQIDLKFGVEFSTGIVIIFLENKIKEKASILEQSLCQGMDDIAIFIQNNSNKDIYLSKGQKLCYVHYNENI